MLRVENLSFSYNNDKFCFKNLNFSLEKNDILCILGLNGQGKTTLLKVLIQILKPNEGKIYIKDNYSYLTQNFNLSFDYNVLDVVLMGLGSKISIFNAPNKNDCVLAKEILNMLKISHLVNRSFNTLSGGQKQLVLFAKALIAKNPLLILDEPLSQVDLKNQNRILSLIKKLQTEFDLSVIFTTHNPAHAQAIANKTLILYENLSYKFGPTKEILTTQNLENLYEIPFEISNSNLLIPIFKL